MYTSTCTSKNPTKVYIMLEEVITATVVAVTEKLHVARHVVNVLKKMTTAVVTIILLASSMTVGGTTTLNRVSPQKDCSPHEDCSRI